MLFFIFLYIGKRYTCSMLEYRRSERRTLTARRSESFSSASPCNLLVRMKRATISRAAAFTNPSPTGLNAARRVGSCRCRRKAAFFYVLTKRKLTNPRTGSGEQTFAATSQKCRRYKVCRACRIEIDISALQRTLAERTLNEYKW